MQLNSDIPLIDKINEYVLYSKGFELQAIIILAAYS